MKKAKTPADRLPAVENSPTVDNGHAPLRRNFVVLAAHQILTRVGWIFKTESIIMPVVMDLLCGPGTALAAWLRSWLPQLNRIGQSIPQLLLSGRLRDAARKKHIVAGCSIIMGIAFFLLAVIWHIYGGEPSTLLRIYFLALYGLFFASFGVSQLGFNTLQGKLIKYNYRGRLFLFGNTVGGTIAIVAAFVLMPKWLSRGTAGIAPMFIFAGLCFFLAGCVTLACRESKTRSDTRLKRESALSLLLLPIRLFRTDGQFRKLATIGALFGTSLVLFPHYQALYRDTLTRTHQPFLLEELIKWVILQNSGTILISWFAGPAADRLGNRLVLQCAMFLVFLTPIIALVISASARVAESWYFVIFLLVGVIPVTIRVLNNFALELTPGHRHTHFLSALSLCVTLPVLLFSQIAGILLPIIGFLPLFLFVSANVLLGWILTFFVVEPRHQLTMPVANGDN